MPPVALSPALAPAVSPALAQGSLRVGGNPGESGGFAAALAQQTAVPEAGATQPGASAPGSWLTASAFKGKSETETRAAIHKSAQDFESTTLGQMLQFMSDSVEVDPEFGGGHGEEMFRQMLTTEYGKMMHKAGGAGIAAQVEPELLRAQGLKPVVTQVAVA